MNKTSLAVAAVAVTGASLALSAAFGQTDDSKLGKVHFETSCKPEAQKLFDRGMLYQHSFWYRASQKTFEDVLKADPDCAKAAGKTPPPPKPAAKFWKTICGATLKLPKPVEKPAETLYWLPRSEGLSDHLVIVMAASPPPLATRPR